MYKVPTHDSVKFLTIADAETGDLSPITANVKQLAHEYDVDFIYIAGDLCRKYGIIEHAEEINEEKMGRETIYTIGNHDIVAPFEDGTNYEDYLAPFWYSFERSGVLFIVVPMSYGDVVLPYNLKTFGDWLKTMLTILPQDMKIVLLSHEVPGRVLPPTIPSNFGNVELGSRLAGAFFGHWHLNMVLHDPQTGAAAYGTAPPHKAGIDHDAGSYRFATIRPNGEISSSLIFHEYPENPRSYQLIKPLPATQEEVTTLYNSPAHNGAKADIEVTELQPAWIAELPTEIGANGRIWNSSPLLIDNKLFIGITDDAEGKSGGVAIFSASTGKFIKFIKLGYSVKNSLAYNGGAVYGNDSRGNIFSIDANTLNLNWIVSARTGGVPPTNNGVIALDGVVYGGFAYELKAVDASGKVVWQNSEWKGSHSCVGCYTIANNMLIANSVWGGTFANDLKSGKLIWKRTERPTIYTAATPVFADGAIWIKGEKIVHALNPQTGEDIFKVDLKTDLQSATPIVVLPQAIIVTTSYQGIFAISRQTGETIWNFKDIGIGLIDTIPYNQNSKTVEAPLTVTQDMVWFGALDGYLYGLELTTGKLKQKYNLSAPIIAAPVVLKDRVYVAPMGRNIYAFEVTK